MTRRTIALFLTILGLACPAPAAEISWEPPGDITGELSDFDREGDVVHAWNSGGGDILLGAGDLDLQFTPGPALANGPVTNIDPHNRNGDINYETLLGTMTWASATATLTLTDLVPGNQYRVQLWLADTRDCCSGRLKTYDSGDGTTQVVLDSGPPSQFVIGNFTADAATQSLRCVGGGGPDHPQYNALVLRDLGPPTPRITRFDLARGTLVSDRGLRIAAGESATLSWTVENADWVTINPAPGSVGLAGSAALSPTATQEYQLTAGNGIGTSSATVTLFVDTPVEPPKLNEILAANYSGIEDEDGDRVDWIELTNPNPFVLSMGAYALSDDPALAAPWAFPADASIPVGGHLLVFASGKNRTGAELHTDFKLDSSGDYLALLENGTLVEQWPADYPDTPTFPEIKEDISYGIDSSGELRFFNDPTPGAPNGEGFSGFVDDTKFSVNRGVFTSPQTVEITTETPDASIRYTTDGTLPSPTRGTLYTGPLAISQTTVLRALAYKDDFAPTNVDTQTYIFPADVIASDVMNPDITQDPRYRDQMEAGLLSLPIFSLTLEDPDQVNNSVEKPVSVEFLPTDDVKGFHVEAGVTRFGGYYTNFDKKNFRLYFRKIYGPGKLKYPLFDGFENGRAAVDQFDALDLRTGSHDMKMRGAYLSNRFTDNSMLEMGHFNPHGRFVHLFINGTYWGQYHLRERWSAAMAAEYFGGKKEDYEAINGNDNQGGDFGPGSPYDGDGSGWEHIKQLAAGPTPWQSLPARVDLAAYLDFMLLFMSGNSETEYRNISQPFDGGVGMQIYLNDADGFLRASGDRTGNPGPGEILGGLRTQDDPDFRMFIADLIQNHFFGGGAMTADRMVERLQKLVDATQLSFLCESARWTGTDDQGNQLYRYPTRTPDSWQSYQDNLLNNYLPGLTNTMISRFRARGFYPSTNAPHFNQDGGVVPPGFALMIDSPSGGTVYFTDDGTDPRLPGGAINPEATILNDTASGSTLVAQGATWRYLDDGSDQGTAWRQEGFDDSAWAAGPAQLGYGDGDEATLLSYGPDSSNKYTTTWFRKTFDVADAATLTGLTLELLRDDGAVVWLNGVEVARTNMPAGTVTSATRASSAIGGANESTFLQFTLDPATLHTGTNTLAVEIHQASATSSDISFDLRLLATTTSNSDPAYVFHSGNTTIMARAMVGGEWSALRDERFIVSETPSAPAPGDLAISEIHYHPTDPTPAELAVLPDLGDGDFEFIELVNISPVPLRLDGCAFTDGIDFVFPEDSILQPGGRLVLCRNPDAFALRHPSVAPFGAFSGHLNNGGETLVLSDPAAVVLVEFTYGDSTAPDWPASPDGGGPSLVLIHPNGNGATTPDDPFLWRASTGNGGAPGTSDAVDPGPPGTDADADGQPRLLEILLGSSDDSASSLPQIEAFFATHPDGRPYMHLRIQHDLAVEASLDVQVSEDLLDWSRQATLFRRTRHDDLTETLEYSFPDTPQGPPQRAFMRVRATQ